MRTRAHIRPFHLCGLLLVLGLVSHAHADASNPPSLLTNGGFEDLVRVPGVPDGGGKHSSWQIKGGPTAPAEWTLSGYFGGELEIRTDGAPEGERYVRMTGTGERQAHLHTACPDVQPGGYYKTSIRYRGGPVSIRAYEYGFEGKAPAIPTIATGTHAEEWQLIEHTYMPGELANVRFVVAVEKGCTADIDDFRVWLAELSGVPGAGWLNVKDFGASGSKFETPATTVADANTITVRNVGDFEVGQGVMISKCHPHYTEAVLRGPGSYYRKSKPLDGVAELRGFDGSGGDWLVFILDIRAAAPLSFRWSDDLARTWKEQNVPITWDWQKLSGGLEIKFLKRDLEPGHGVTFSARTQLLTTIKKIEGNTLWVAEAPSKSVTDAVVRHCEAKALQEAIDCAIAKKRQLHFPNGYYRLEHGLVVRNGALRIEGASGVHTIMDISDGRGSVFSLQSGREVTIRNFRMIGHTGFDEKAGTLRNVNDHPFWCCALKPCNAVGIHGTERVLCENVHAVRMATEAFYCQGPSRTAPDKSPAIHTKSLTFLRCSVTDCAANAFNNNDTSENTAVLYCRIDGAAWHAYEGPGRFIKLIGNYVRNAGPFTIGDMNHRYKPLLELGCGQAVVIGNTFEGCDGRNGGIAVNYGAAQVTIANNVFVNYNGTAITVAGHTTRRSYPAQNMVVVNNIIDLTYKGGKKRSRTGILIKASDVIASGNQVFVRDGPDARANGIRIEEPAVNVTVNDNLVRNCAIGIGATRCRSAVTELFEDGSFTEASMPLEWPTGHRYRGWNLAWLSRGKDAPLSTIEAFDAETCRFKLVGDTKVQPNEPFSIFPPSACWTIHDNTITDCQRPVSLDAYGSPTSVFRNNTVNRGHVTEVKHVISVGGQFKLIGNHVFGFDEPGSTALMLRDAGFRRCRSALFLHNIFESCSGLVQESAPGLWDAATKVGNLFINCTGEQDTGSDTSATAVSAVLVETARSRAFLAPKLASAVNIDGDVGEWPWSDVKRVTDIRHTHDGVQLAAPAGRMCAAWDTANLYLALRVTKEKDEKLTAGLNWQGDGVELSLRGVNRKQLAPILVLWGTTDGRFNGSAAMGAPAEQVQQIEKEAKYAARGGTDEWTCEWKLPFTALGLTAAPEDGFKLNVGLRSLANDSWAAWVPTGTRICEVDQGGDLHLTE